MSLATGRESAGALSLRQPVQCGAESSPEEPGAGREPRPGCLFLYPRREDGGLGEEGSRGSPENLSDSEVALNRLHSVPRGIKYDVEGKGGVKCKV